MGKVHKANLSLLRKVITTFLDAVLKDVRKAANKVAKFDLMILDTTYVLSLRVNEGFILNLSIVKREMKIVTYFLVIALKGRQKGHPLSGITCSRALI